MLGQISVIKRHDVTPYPGKPKAQTLSFDSKLCFKVGDMTAGLEYPKTFALRRRRSHHNATSDISDIPE